MSDVHHSVYVIRLAPQVLDTTKFRDANPAYREGKPCVYVGMTGLTPEERFANHKRGHKASSFAKRYGLHLMKRQYQKLNPLSYEDALRMEATLAKRLRKKGWAVWQH